MAAPAVSPPPYRADGGDRYGEALRLSATAIGVSFAPRALTASQGTRPRRVGRSGVPLKESTP
ncbi:hypothetical protein [Solimonas variicoloris]|uniref:hypothetical protein n=1 Tax=Solimonas variicoloris TaxID=254408 RepID=UPI0012B52E88|nr:hypothetical protein [Solimonas variicoloris]